MKALWNGLTALAQDVRIGFRLIGRMPLLASAVVMTLSLGIGVAAGVFSLLNPLAFSAAVNDEPETFFKVDTSRRDITLEEYHTFRTEGRSFKELAAWATLPFARLNSEDGPGVTGALVSCNIFSVFREKPALGRLIQPADCEATAGSVMVLSQQLWQESFSADANVIGKTVSYFGLPVTIVGVLSPGWSMNANSNPFSLTADAWVSTEPGFADKVTKGGISWLHLAGRLQPNYSRQLAETELELIERRLNEEPAAAGRAQASRPITLTDGSLWSSLPQFRWQFLLALALPTLLLLIASVNVATLLLSRAAGRQREMAIRIAIGAGKLRLVRMLLVESSLLVFGAAALSLMLVYWIPAVLYRYLLAPGGEFIPPQDFFSPDWHVFLYLGVCMVVAVLGSGMTPSLESMNLRLTDSLAGRQFSGGSRNASRLRGLMVAVQVAMSTVPLITVAMFLRTEGRLTDPGFETRQVVEIRLLRRLNADQTPSSVAERLETLPGLRSVAYSWDVPGMALNALQVTPYQGTPLVVPTTSVSATYFETLGIPIVAGQSFQNLESSETVSNPVVVSQRLVKRLFPEVNPLGMMLDTEWGQMTIVGIARDIAGFEAQGPADGTFIYQLIRKDESGVLLGRFEGNLEHVSAGIQTVAQGATGARAELLPLYAVMNEYLEPVRRIEILLATLGAISLVLAIIGVFGVASFTTNQRRKEIAIRLAVGATPPDIVRTILARGLRPILIGIAAGLPLSFAGLRLAASQQFLPGALLVQDPIPYVVVGLLLLLVTIAAMLASARGTVWSDSVSALHEE